MLIYIMSTASILHFLIIKMGKFNVPSGRTHFKALIQLLNYYRYNHSTFDITHYSELCHSPFTQLFKDLCEE